MATEVKIHRNGDQIEVTLHNENNSSKSLSHSNVWPADKTSQRQSEECQSETRARLLIRRAESRAAFTALVDVSWDGRSGANDLAPTRTSSPTNEIESVTSSLAALGKYDSGKYDLILTDRCLPGMTGLDLAHRIKSQDPFQPILLLTGFPPGGSQPDIDLVMRKPFSGDELRRAVCDLTARGTEVSSVGAGVLSEAGRELVC